MNPLPALVSNSHESGDGSLPPALVAGQGIYSSANRRASSSQIYPWLLCASTLLAAVFCLMYITKPVIVASPGVSSIAGLESPTLPKSSAAATQQSHAGLMPSADRLPGEKGIISASPRQALPTPHQSGNVFEETNLRIQHILTAEAPGGHLARIDIDVPVLYQSRNLRWTSAEVAEARALLIRLGNYQEKSQILRAEGVELLDSWNHLIEHSIPNGDLRADSPTLPVNQQDAADTPRPAGLNTSESIKIQPSGK